MKDPKPIKLSGDELERVKKEISESNLSDATKILINGLIQLCLWMQIKLENSRISINKLKRLFFINSEKRGHKNNPLDNNSIKSSTSSNESDDQLESINPEKADDNILTNLSSNTADPTDKRPGHGRLKADDYTGSELVQVAHHNYKAGDDCPTDCGGRLYDTNEPGLFIYVQGNNLFKATRYETQALRCALCGEYYKASIPKYINEKYDEKAKAVICVQKYQMGMPLYRLATWQKQVGIPIPDTTAWELIKKVDEPVAIIFDLLITLAAQSNLFYQDDTFVRILSVIAANKKNTDKHKRRGMFTTGIVAYYKQYPIYLFLSGTNHAGENLGEILSHRDNTLPAPIQMCDALSRNHIKASIETILCYCLVHGRRQFVDIESVYPKDCEFVLDCIAQIYKNDADCKQQKHSDMKRLQYHQAYSASVMANLNEYIVDKLAGNSIEPNCPLAAAFRYMQNHWDKLTKFLVVAGAPLDTNTVERSLKLAIRVRKASMFFKTTNGAKVANHMMSVIHTALQSGIEPVAYLTALQKYKEYVVKEPMQWLPWYYEATIANLNQVSAIAA